MSTDLAKEVRAVIKSSNYRYKADLMALYTTLVINRDYDKNTCKMSYEKIHEATGWCTEKIHKVISKLNDLGIIEYYSGDSSGRTNLYAFPLERFGKKRSMLPPQVKKVEKSSEKTKSGEIKKNKEERHLSNEEMMAIIKKKEGETNDDKD